MDRELIVSRYKEDIAWVRDSPIPVTLYNKGTHLDLGTDNPNIDVIALPNWGREAGTWLTHITRNYDSLADWSFFVQGSPHLPMNEIWQRLSLPYEDTTPLTVQYMDEFPKASIKALDRIEHIGDVEYHYGLADWHGGRTPDQNAEWLASIWAQLFTCPQPDPWWFGYAAEFAVPKHRITDRPLAYWLWLEDLCRQDGNNVEQSATSAWGFEVAWAYLWGDACQYPGHEIEKVERPGLLSMAGNFVKSMATQALAGNPTVSQDVQDLRKAICFECVPWHEHETDSCIKCGCSGKRLAWKRSMATQACPVGKWAAAV